MKELVIKGFEAGRKLTIENFEDEDWAELDEILIELGFEKY